MGPTCRPRESSNCFPLLPPGPTCTWSRAGPASTGSLESNAQSSSCSLWLSAPVLPLVFECSSSHTRSQAQVSVLGHGMSLGSQSSLDPAQPPGKGFQLKGWSPPTPSAPSSLLQPSSGTWLLLCSSSPQGQCHSCPWAGHHPTGNRRRRRRGEEEGKKKKMNPHKNVFITGNVS